MTLHSIQFFVSENKKKFYNNASELKERMQSSRKRSLVNLSNSKRIGIIKKEVDEK
jgi:hypothetical protein